MRYLDEGEPPRVSIVTMRNESSEAGLELIFSEALRREVLSRGAMKLVRDPGEARFVVRGSMGPLVTQRRSFTGARLAREYQLTMKVDWEIEDLEHAGGLQDGVSRPREISASEIYLASADAEAGLKNRHEALVYLSGSLARQVHDAIDRVLLSVAAVSRDRVAASAARAEEAP